MKIKYLILLLVLWGAGCNKNDISENVESIKLVHINYIREGNKTRGIKQTVNDTLDLVKKEDREIVLEVLEDKQWEPRKALPRYRIEITYKNKHKESFGVIGNTIKQSGKTFHTDMNLGEWIKNKFIQSGRLNPD